MSNSLQPVHLHVLVHGMWGNPNHLDEAAKQLKLRFEKESEEQASSHIPVVILIASTNADEGTYDGIDWGGERVVEEIDEKIKALKDYEGQTVTKLSCTGYSLGGLIARYTVGILSQRGFFNEVEPCNFTTIASPWIGLVRYDTLVSGVMHKLGPKMLGRTGPQFYCEDSYSTTGRPLIEIMSDPDLLFYQALTKFKRLAVYANAIHDLTVPYATSSFELRDPFAGYDAQDNDFLELEYDPDYYPLLKSYKVLDTPKKKEKVPKTFLETVNSWKPQTIPGPFIEWRFPYNLILIGLLPILAPTFITLVAIRFSSETRKSAARLKEQHKKDDASGMRSRLEAIFGNIEKSMEQAAEDIVQQTILPAGEPSSSQHFTPEQLVSSPSSPTLSATDTTRSGPTSSAVSPVTSGTSTPVTVPARHMKGQPRLKDIQVQMVHQLNKLPNLKKQLAFIYPARNTHAIIVCRTMSMVEHRRGAGVVKHWADHFEP